MAAHRYWRVYITANCADGVGGQGYVSLMEVELRTSNGGSNVATGGTASASSTGFSWTAAGAFNGSTGGTGWHSGTNALPGTPEWIKYDFGAGNDKDIVEFKLHARPTFDEQWPRDFKLQYSDDNSTWTTLYEVAGETLWPEFSMARTYSANSIPNEAGVARRFWRLRATANNGGANFSLGELMMYVAGSSANQCTGGAPFASSLGSAASTTEAFDGVGLDSTNYWAAYSTTGWIGYRFSSAKTITVIGIKSRVNNQTESPKDFVLEYWDGSAFQTAMNLTNITGWGNGQTRYFDSTGEVGGPPAGAAVRPQIFVCC